MPKAITHIEQATSEWLTTVLQRSDALPRGAVQAVNVARVFTEQLHSQSYFLHVVYTADAPSTTPTRLFLKLPRPELELRRAAGFGVAEVRMYQLLQSHQQHLPVVRCYDAVYDDDQQWYHLLLEDVSATHDQPAWHLAIGDFYVAQTVDCLAQFHAYWWAQPQHLATFDAPPTAAAITAEIADLQHAFPRFVAIAGSQLQADDQRVYIDVLAALPTLWQNRTSWKEQTLAHGDAHFWNFVYPLDPQQHHTCLIDWQNAHIGSGLKDLAYTLVLRYPHRTPLLEQALVQRYHAGLLHHGVTGYGWEQCWQDYRCEVAQQVLSPLRYWHSGLPETFWRTFMARPLVAFRELACDQVLVN